MKRVALLVFLLSLFSTASAQHRHVHGEGRIALVIGKDTITLELELPLDAAVGFERAPKTEKEKAALADAEKTLGDAARLWLPTPDAACRPVETQVGMPRLSEGEHADIRARYVFRCAQPAALKGIETTLFKAFRRLYRLEAQRVGPNGQGAQRLTPKQPVIAW